MHITAGSISALRLQKIAAGAKSLVLQTAGGYIHMLPLTYLHECALAVCYHAIQLAIAHAVLLCHNPAHVTLQTASMIREM
jgi:hypothetical protein